MSENHTAVTTVNRTRWGRSSVLLAGSLAGSAALAASLMGTGAYASEFVSTSAQTEAVLYGLRTPENGAYVRGITTHDYNGNPDTEYVATFHLPLAYANTVCLTHKMEMLGQPVTLVLDLGDKDPSTTELTVEGINLDVLSADLGLTLYGDTSINQAPTTIASQLSGTPSVIPLSDDEVGLYPKGGAFLERASATVLNAELIRAEGVPMIDARIVYGDVDCPPPI